MQTLKSNPKKAQKRNALQFAKEERIRENGGTFIRDRNTRNLIDIKEVETRTSKRN